MRLGGRAAPVLSWLELSRGKGGSRPELVWPTAGYSQKCLLLSGGRRRNRPRVRQG